MEEFGGRTREKKEEDWSLLGRSSCPSWLLSGTTDETNQDPNNRLDVYFGRSHLAVQSVGNQRLRAMVEEKLPEYEHYRADKGPLATRNKTALIVAVYNQVTRNGGRFLKRNKHGHWVEATYNESRRKISHLFRDHKDSTSLGLTNDGLNLGSPSPEQDAASSTSNAESVRLNEERGPTGLDSPIIPGTFSATEEDPTSSCSKATFFSETRNNNKGAECTRNEHVLMDLQSSTTADDDAAALSPSELFDLGMKVPLLEHIDVCDNDESEKLLEPLPMGIDPVNDDANFAVEGFSKDFLESVAKGLLDQEDDEDIYETREHS